MAIKTIKRAELGYKYGSSDKVYNVDLEENDFIEDEFNEFLLVNWKPIAVVKSYKRYPSSDDEIMTAEQLAEKHNLPLIDENGQRIK